MPRLSSAIDKTYPQKAHELLHMLSASVNGTQAYVATKDDFLIDAFRETDSEDAGEKYSNIATDVRATLIILRIIEDSVRHSQRLVFQLTGLADRTPIESRWGKCAFRAGLRGLQAPSDDDEMC